MTTNYAKQVYTRGRKGLVHQPRGEILFFDSSSGPPAVEDPELWALWKHTPNTGRFRVVGEDSDGYRSRNPRATETEKRTAG